MHDTIIAPDWPRARACVGSEATRPAGEFTRGGVEQTLAALRPPLSWQLPVLTADYPAHYGDLDIHLNGRGLVLIPAYFCRVTPVALVDRDLPRVLVYPVTATGGEPDAGSHAAALEALLGPTRARVLLALGRSRCTGGLARLLGVAESTVSEHVRVLRASGLVHSVYTGRWRMHTLTPLGAGLAFPRSPR